MESELTLMPSFVYNQSEETAIHVVYYYGTIQLKQLDNSIYIDEKDFLKLVKEITKHQKIAKENIK